MTSPSTEHPAGSASSLPDRLESWKEIAAYLNRSVTTVQRWEAEEGLPVHRLLHAKAGSVYGVKHELDAWFHARDARGAAHDDGADGVPAAATTDALIVSPGAAAAPAAPPGPGSPSPDVRRQEAAETDTPGHAMPGAAGHALASTPLTSGTRVPPSRPPRVGPWFAVAAVAVCVGGFGAVGGWRSGPEASREIVRAELGVGPAQELDAGGFLWTVATRGGARTALAWTPDGRRLVFVGRQGDRQQLFVRDLSSADASPLDGTEGAQVPAVSPDGRWVVFWTAGELRRIALDGGPAEALLDGVFIPPAGIAVGETGRIVFSAGAPPGAPFTELIYELRAGQAPVALTTHRPGELAHLTPQLIQHDRVLLFTVKRTGIWGHEQVVVQDLSSGARQVLVEDASEARYLPSGYLVFLRRGLLMAARMDLARLRLAGTPTAMLDGVAHAVRNANLVDVTGAGQFAVSSTGALAYVAGTMGNQPQLVLVEVDRQGRFSPLPFEPRSYDPTLGSSPDGRRIVVAIDTLTDAGLFIADRERKTLQRLPSWGEPMYPRWSPDGDWVAFVTLREGAWELARQRADGSAPAETILPGQWWLSSWSPDGHQLAAICESDIWIITIGDRAPTTRRLTHTPAWDGSPAFSPDGRWLAYASTITGDPQVYVRPFPEDGPTLTVSAAGGTNPMWNPRGGELFYLHSEPAVGHGEDPDRKGAEAVYRTATRRVQMMVVPITGSRIGTPRPLFDLTPANLGARCTPNPCYAVSPDGQRFYMSRPVLEPRPQPVTHIQLVLNWTAELEAKLGAGR